MMSGICSSPISEVLYFIWMYMYLFTGDTTEPMVSVSDSSSTTTVTT